MVLMAEVELTETATQVNMMNADKWSGAERPEGEKRLERLVKGEECQWQYFESGSGVTSVRNQQQRSILYYSVS